MHPVPGARLRVLVVSGVAAVVVGAMTLPSDRVAAGSTSFLLAGEPEAAVHPLGTDMVVGDADHTRAVVELHGLINRYRVDHGRTPLQRDPRIDALAERWALQMAATGDFRHSGDYPRQLPSGWHGAAENIAMTSVGAQQSPEQMAQRVFELWTTSPGHRTNVVDEAYDTAGVGVARSRETVYAVQYFVAYQG